MILDWSKVKILLKPGATDFRKQINGLSVIIEEDLKLNVFADYVFLFCNKNRRRMKILYWDKNGFCLWLKRLEQDKVPWPKDEIEAREITYEQLKLLLKGINFFTSHVRRKFMDALKITKKAGSANVALSYIQKIYHHEKILREKKLPDEMFVIERKKLVEPILNDFYKWLNEKKLQVPPQTKIGEAVNYAINEWLKVIRYLEAAFLTPGNNAAENAVRLFVLGRKNRLFNNTPLGAHASATIYSLIEMVKANNLEPYRYLRYLFERLPQVKSTDELAKLLPHRIDRRELFKQ